MQLFSLDGKIAPVTGASRGLGEAIRDAGGNADAQSFDLSDEAAAICDLRAFETGHHFGRVN